VGAGLHTTQTVGLALATDLSQPETRPKVVGLMYVMLLVGTMASAVLFGALLSDYSHGKLVQVIQGAAVLTVVLNAVAVWKQEPRRSAVARSEASAERPLGFQETWSRFIAQDGALRRLVAVGLGTMAFSMEDVLLEPYGGQILHLSVGDTTKLTATLAIGGLAGFGLASRVLSRGADPVRMAGLGALAGLPAFALVISSAALSSTAAFALGTFLIGFGAGLFGHGTLTATMNLAPRAQAGLALGAWGAVQASAAGLAIALGGIIRDAVDLFGPAVAGRGALGPAAGYHVVYALEIGLLAITLIAMHPVLGRARSAA
jgi:BCD family chlorophyll transporter-like MFS transporter